MARTIHHGRTQPVSAPDFNERVKRLLDAKPDQGTKPVDKKPVKRQPWTGSKT